MRDARNCSRLQVRCVANEWSFMQMNKDEFHSQASTDHNVSHAFILGQFKGVWVTYIHFSRTGMLWTVCLFPHLMYVWFWMEMGDQIRIVNHRDPESMEKERHIDSWPWQSILSNKRNVFNHYHDEMRTNTNHKWYTVSYLTIIIIINSRSAMSPAHSPLLHTSPRFN